MNRSWKTHGGLVNYRHEYGLSPVCSRWWIFSLNPKANPFPHSSQIWDFSRGTGCKWMYKAFARILVLTGWTTSFVYQDTKQPKNSLLANLFIAQWDFCEYCWDFSHLPFTFMTSLVSFPSIPSVKCFCTVFASVWSEKHFKILRVKFLIIGVQNCRYRLIDMVNKSELLYSYLTPVWIRLWIRSLSILCKKVLRLDTQTDCE